MIWQISSVRAKALMNMLPVSFRTALRRVASMRSGAALNYFSEKEQKRLGTRCLLHEGLLLELNELLGSQNVVLKTS